MRRELDRHITGNWGEDQDNSDTEGSIELLIENGNKGMLRVVNLSIAPSDIRYHLDNTSIEVLRAFFESLDAKYVRTTSPLEEIYSIDL